MYGMESLRTPGRCTLERGLSVRVRRGQLIRRSCRSGWRARRYHLDGAGTVSDEAPELPTERGEAGEPTAKAYGPRRGSRTVWMLGRTDSGTPWRLATSSARASSLPGLGSTTSSSMRWWVRCSNTRCRSAHRRSNASNALLTSSMRTATRPVRCRQRTTVRRLCQRLVSRLVLPALVVIFVARSEAVARDRELPEPPRRAKTGDRTHGRDIGVRWVVTCTATNCYRDQARAPLGTVAAVEMCTARVSQTACQGPHP